MEKLNIDLDKILRSRIGGWKGRLIPGFLISALERLIHQRELNEILDITYPAEGAEFSRRVYDYLDLDITVKATPSSMHSFYEISSRLRGHGRFIATTVDTIFRPEAFRRYVELWENAPRELDGMMAMTRYIDDEKPLYIDTPGDNEPIVAFRDEPWPGARYISGGIYGLAGRAITVLEECMAKGVSRMRNYQRQLLASGLSLLGHDMGKILDVDHVADVVKAEAFLNSES